MQQRIQIDQASWTMLLNPLIYTCRLILYADALMDRHLLLQLLNDCQGNSKKLWRHFYALTKQIQLIILTSACSIAGRI